MPLPTECPQPPPPLQLYLSHTEAQTFLKNLRAGLGLEPGASLEALTNRVAQLLEHRRGGGGQGRRTGSAAAG